MAKQRTRHPAPQALILPPSVARSLGDEAGTLLDALGDEAPVSIRLNPLKPAGIGGERVPWCEQGRYLPERPSFTLDPLLHAGAYYVQEASSMLVEQAFLATGLKDRDSLVLDLCAAPGGKSTHLASLLSQGSLLVCNETVPARRGPLMENLWKQGRRNAVVTGGTVEDLAGLQGLFDLILVDAPCSGEGMFRKDPFARRQWNEGLVRSCATIQRDILDNAWQALSPGGWLIYSTCTWERAENEEQMFRLMTSGAEPVQLVLPDEWGIVTSDVGHRCYPHRVRGEGFFMALLRKPGQLGARSLSGAAEEDGSEVREWLTGANSITLREHEQTLYASACAWSSLIDKLSANVKVLSPGTPVAERKGGTWRPGAALALSGYLAASIFGTIDLSLDEALTFLRGETALPLGSNGGDQGGVRLVRYAGLPLGWMHAAGDRWNNGWPKPWRIRMR